MRRSQLALVTFALSFLSSPGPALAVPGQVLDEQQISDTDGGFGGVLVDEDQFGAAVAPLGDLDGDSIVDIAVGAPLTAGGGLARGAAWLPLPGAVGPTYFAQDSRVILQLVGSQGACWSTDFQTTAQKNEPSAFKDKLP